MPCNAIHHQHVITSFKVRHWSSVVLGGKEEALDFGIWYFGSLVICDVREGGSPPEQEVHYLRPD